LETETPALPRRRRFGKLAAIAIAFVFIGTTVAQLATPTGEAMAAIGGHGPGYFYSDGTSFLGAYVLSGRNVYCLEAGKQSPVGRNFGGGTEDTSRYSLNDRAKMSYVMRTWGGSSDPRTTAAVQLAIWHVTGWNGHDANWYSYRVQNSSDRNAVMANYNSMVNSMNSNASTGAGSTVAVTLAEDGKTGSVISQVTYNTLSGVRTAGAGAHSGTITLSGGVFTANGNASMTVSNGVSYAVTPNQGAIVSVGATASYGNLPYGARMLTHFPDVSTVQMMISQSPTNTSASGVATDPPVYDTTGPFQLEVSTQSSKTMAYPGDTLFDQLAVNVATTEDNPEAYWGQYAYDQDDYRPIPVKIRSTLWGPYSEPPAETNTLPSDPGEIFCEVFLSGPDAITAVGNYTTDTCTITERGYFVWTTEVRPSDTPVAQGRAKVVPYQSAFGISAETTLVPWEPKVVTQASKNVVTTGTCVSDTLNVTGTEPGRTVDVLSSLWGPFDTAPAVGSMVNTATSPLAGSDTVQVSGDGAVMTACHVLPTSGYYVFTFESQGGGATVPFESDEVFAAETVLVQWDVEVVTAVNVAEGIPGDCVSDVVNISGMRLGAEVEVTSNLWGPFDAAPEPGSFIDPDTAALENTTVFTVAGNDNYITACSELMEPGFYVYTFDSDGDREMAPFSSLEVFEAETTLIMFQATVTTQVTHARAIAGETCIADTFVISGMQPGSSAEVTSEMWGPFPVAPVVGSFVDPETATLVSSNTFTADDNGEFISECTVLVDSGHYVYTHRSVGNATTADFTSYEVFASEMTVIDPLAFTGSDGVRETVAVSGALVIVGGLAIWFGVFRRKSGNGIAKKFRA
jgi:hypothetical protein